MYPSEIVDVVKSPDLTRSRAQTRTLVKECAQNGTNRGAHVDGGRVNSTQAWQLHAQGGAARGDHDRVAGIDRSTPVSNKGAEL